ncbi:protein SpAN [Rhipicephalus microplus]|uniref:protein SpAN n=1 Tax=Rhipicephalus microplus TaxID=6941 RepID=UPI003F6CE222
MIPRRTTLLFALLGLTCAQYEESIEHLVSGQPEVLQEQKEKSEMFERMWQDVQKMDGGEAMYQGDMMMTKSDLMDMYAMSPTKNETWPGGMVPYKIHESLSDEAHLIRQGIAHWMKNTCLVFRELEKDEITTDYILFFKGEGCWSRFGYKGSVQEISIGEGCEKLGTVVHEIGHAIGFIHEQSRADRDRYVVVKYANILKGEHSQFDPDQRGREYGAVYDYTSVMHYSPTAFAVSPGVKTLSPVNPLLAPLIRRRDELTFRDRRKANFLYRCDAACKSRPVCENEGFVDHTCKCVCPPNTKGERCQKWRHSYYPRTKCGRRVIREQTISSPGYPKMQIPEVGTCVWWIQAPRNKTVQLTFRGFDLYGRVSGFCTRDWFEIRLKSLYMGQTFCSDEMKPGKVVTSVGRNVIIEYRPYAWFKRGFSLQVKFVPVETRKQ